VAEVTTLGRARAPGQPIPPGVQEAITAAVVDGAMSHVALARHYGVSPAAVDRLAQTVRGLDLAVVSEIRRGLPALLTVLAGAHAAKALELVDENPKQAVNSTFGAKLAVEAGRGAEPGAAAPGAQMLTFIQQLNVGTPRAEPVVIEVPSAMQYWEQHVDGQIEVTEEGPDAGPE
jgi:hypothetical protein